MTPANVCLPSVLNTGPQTARATPGLLLHGKAQWVEVKTQPKMDPAFCYFCFLTKVGMVLALRLTHPGSSCLAGSGCWMDTT